MGTRSAIGLQLKGDKIKGIYAHWDGYPSNNGKILKEHYTTEAKVKELIDLGSISSLAPSVEKPEGHTFDTPVKGYTVAYGRDRGEKDQEARTFRNLKDFKKGNDWAEWLYVFNPDKKKWYYMSSDENKLRPLTDAGIKQDKAEGGTLEYKQGGNVDREVKAKPRGYRFKGEDNNKRPLVRERGDSDVYFEGRKNRSDKNLTKKLEEGGIGDTEFEEGGLTPEQDKLINELAEDFKPEVVRIEKKPATTKNHYGDYASLLSAVAKNQKIAKIFSIALKRAGADKQGVDSALQVMYGQYEEGGETDNEEDEQYYKGGKHDRGTRPSPRESATLYRVGERRFGQDNNLWEIVEDIRGVKRWKKVYAEGGEVEENDDDDFAKGGKLKLKKGDGNMTHLVGYIDITYKELIDALGEPHYENGDKTLAEWAFEDNGVVFTIYDYKNSFQDVEDITDWHIGGHDSKAVDAVMKHFPNAKITNYAEGGEIEIREENKFAEGGTVGGSIWNKNYSFFDLFK